MRAKVDRISTYSRTQPTPTHFTRPDAFFTFSKVRRPPSLYTTWVIPTLESFGSAPSTGERLELGFQDQDLTHRAPICCKSSTKIPDASSPSVVWTSTCTTAPCRACWIVLKLRRDFLAGLGVVTCSLDEAMTAGFPLLRRAVLERRFGEGLLLALEYLRVGERTGTFSSGGMKVGFRTRGEERVGDMLDSDKPLFRDSLRGDTSPSAFKGTLDTVWTVRISSGWTFIGVAGRTLESQFSLSSSGCSCSWNWVSAAGICSFNGVCSWSSTSNLSISGSSNISVHLLGDWINPLSS